MREKRVFALGSLLITLVSNGVLLGATYYFLEGPIREQGLLTAFAAGGAGITLILWLAVALLGSKLIGRAAAEGPAATRAEAERPAGAPIEAARDAAALQVLSLLQRQGRFIDFLQEDLSAYQDAQIGAAVRNIHAGCKQALSEHFDLEPVLGEPEGAQVTVQAGFDRNAVRLSGDVVGDPPFRGTLRHRGWRVKRLELPIKSEQKNAAAILAPAEVEVNA